MAEEKHEAHAEEGEGKKKGGSKKLIIIIIAVAVVLGGGGFAAFSMLSKGKAEGEHKEKKAEEKSVLIALDPFVLNLAEQGRFLKVTMQIELSDPIQQPVITQKVPQLRDAIITLISSKSVESVSTPEGKFQLKDELLLRINQTIGKDVIKNLYFTEFVMQ